MCVYVALCGNLFGHIPWEIVYALATYLYPVLQRYESPSQWTDYSVTHSVCCSSAYGVRTSRTNCIRGGCWLTPWPLLLVEVDDQDPWGERLVVFD